MSADENTEPYKLDFGVQRRDMPLVNRLIRFTSLTPEIFTFENGEESIIIPTDENGFVSAPINIISDGKGISLVHLLYVGANTKVTNISHEEYMTLDISSPSPASLIIDNPSSLAALYNIFVPYLFLAVASLFLIGYFKRLRKGEEYPIIAEVMMATFLSFSSISKHIIYMVPFFIIEVVLFYVMIFSQKIYFPVFCMLLAMTSYFVPRDRAYSVFFMLFAMLTIVHFMSFFISQIHAPLHMFEKFSFISNWYILIPLFILLTAFFSNVYIPFIVLSIMYVIFPFTTASIHFSMAGILIGCLIFILKRIYNFRTLIFYKLNILKVDI